MEAEIVFVGRLTTEDDKQSTATPQEIEHVLETTMDKLVKLGFTDPAVSGSCESGEIRISVVVTDAELVDRQSLWDTPRTAAFLGIPPATMGQWAYLGKGPRFVKVGKHRRYRPADVEKWLSAHEQGPCTCHQPEPPT